MTMSLEQIARFLDQHPDWSPSILMIDGKFRFHGFNGPQGGYFTEEEIAALIKMESYFPAPERRGRRADAK
jgi:hypothetical protein